jgi:hypothetical protein
MHAHANCEQQASSSPCTRHLAGTNARFWPKPIGVLQLSAQWVSETLLDPGKRLQAGTGTLSGTAGIH